MGNDELIAALRRTMVETGSLACLGCGHEHNCSTQGCAILREAAELIERLQGQLAESQRRERAAVELIGKVSQAVEVAFNATDYVKPNTGIWHTLGLALDWIKAWRGPQEAGEGA